jgi:hypothetical protein
LDFLGKIGPSIELATIMLVLGAVDITHERLPVQRALMYHGYAMLEAVLLRNMERDVKQVSRNVRAGKQDLEIFVTEWLMAWEESESKEEH